MMMIKGENFQKKNSTSFSFPFLSSVCHNNTRHLLKERKMIITSPKATKIFPQYMANPRLFLEASNFSVKRRKTICST